MNLFTLFYTFTCVAALPRARASLDLLLTAISKIPELSTFYSLFEGTGGELGKPGPDFDERFNDPGIGLLFTAFAPKNDAFAKLPPGLISALTLPHSYELLKSILNTHIAPGNLSDAELEAGKTIEMIEGFTATFDKDGSITTNVNPHSSGKTFPAQANLVRTSAGDLDCSEAFNGRICKIDGILDGFLTYFGEDSTRESTTLPSTTSSKGTMRDVIQQSSELSSLHSALQEIDPAVLTRLSLFSQEEGAQSLTIFLAPSNAAVEAFPQDAVASLLQPTNAGLSRFLLKFGLGQLNTDSQVLSSEEGFNITIKGDQVMNAQITSRINAENGCIWTIGRFLDPLLAF